MNTMDVAEGMKGQLMKQKELCIRCNKPTLYNPNTPITLRRYYVKGSGQLCPLCYQELYGVAPSLCVSFGTGLESPQTSDEKCTDFIPNKL